MSVVQGQFRVKETRVSYVGLGKTGKRYDLKQEQRIVIINGHSGSEAKYPIVARQGLGCSSRPWAGRASVWATRDERPAYNTRAAG